MQTHLSVFCIQMLRRAACSKLVFELNHSPQMNSQRTHTFATPPRPTNSFRVRRKMKIMGIIFMIQIRSALNGFDIFSDAAGASYRNDRGNFISREAKCLRIFIEINLIKLIETVVVCVEHGHKTCVKRTSESFYP